MAGTWPFCQVIAVIINDGNLFLVYQSFHHGYYCGYWMVPDASCWNVKALFPDERHLDECH